MRAAELLLQRVAAELDTDLEHLDPKDVMRYDRDVYDACYVYGSPDYVGGSRS